MSGQLIGYSHAIFGGKNSDLLHIANEVDKNNNGLIDVYTVNGKKVNEVELFKKAVKRDYGYDFSFDGITQCEKKNIDIFDGHNRIYNDYYSVNAKYKSSLTKTMKTLDNPYEDFKKEEAKKYYKQNGLNIAFMTDEDYTNSVKSVATQIVDINKQSELEAQKKEEQKRQALKDKNAAITDMQKEKQKRLIKKAETKGICAIKKEGDFFIIKGFSGKHNENLSGLKRMLCIPDGVISKYNEGYGKYDYNGHHIDNKPIDESINIKIPIYALGTLTTGGALFAKLFD